MNARQPKSVFSKIAFLFLFFAPALTMAGTFSFTGGSWSSFTGTGAGNTSAFSSDPSVNGGTPSLTLTSPASGDTYTLAGTYAYTITWTPANSMDTPPANVVVTFHRLGTLIASGSGVASILNGGTQLLEMDSTNNILSGASAGIGDVTFTLPIVLQSSGAYTASGTFVSDTLSVTYNSGGSPLTSAQETFSLYTMVASS